MKVSVIVCTYNRSHSLAKALDSVAASTLPEDVEWEVLVVRNNSCDQTRDGAEDFCQRHPRFRYLFESQQGKSYALNRGIREARGDALAFMDDDVTVESTWLRNLTASLRHGEFAGAGGRTLPGRTFSAPNWLSMEEPYNLGDALCGLFDIGDKPCELDRPPYGTNMAFRKAIFDRFGGFRTDMGPRPGSEIRNEDTEFGRRLLAAGVRLRYEPSAVVRHAIPDDRLTKGYFLAWWYDYGRALVREWGRKPDVLGMPRAYVSMCKVATTKMPRNVGRWMLALNPRRRFYCKCLVWMAIGQIMEFYRLARPKAQSVAGELT